MSIFAENLIRKAKLLKMNLLNEDYLHLFLKGKIYVTEKQPAKLETVRQEAAVVEQETEIRNEKSPFRFETIGNFAKKILIVLHKDEEKAEDDFNFLFKILAACNLTENDFQIIEADKSQSNFSDIMTRFKPNLCIFFGNFDEIFFDKREIFPYFLQNIAGNTILAADNLSQLSLAPDRKKRLWQTLQLVQFQKF